MNIYIICDELHRDSAGTIRQKRWIQRILIKSELVEIYNIESSFHYSNYTLKKDFDEKRLKSTLKSPTKNISARHGRLAEIGRFFKQALLFNFLKPVYLFVFYKLAKKILKSSENNLFFVSSPSFPLAFLTSLLKTIFPKKIILNIDMRDPWALHWALPTWKIHRFIEKYTLSKADNVSTVSEYLRTQFKENYSLESTVLYNDAKELNITEYTKNNIINSNKNIFNLLKKSKTTILYTGSTPEKFYDINLITNHLVYAVKYFEKNNIDVTFLFVGVCTNLEARLLAEVKKENIDYITSKIKFYPPVLNTTSRVLQAEANILLFLGHNIENNGGYITTKIFEYLSTSKPIITIGVRQDSDVYNLLKYHLHKVQTNQNKELFVKNIIDNLTSPKKTKNFKETSQKTLEDYDKFILNSLKLLSKKL